MVSDIFSKRLSCLGLSENADLKKKKCIEFLKTWLSENSYLKMKPQNVELLEVVCAILRPQLTIRPHLKTFPSKS